MSLSDRAFVGLQHLLPRKLLTAGAGAFARRRIPLLTPWIIRRFIHAYDVRMEEAAQPDPASYRTFNAFFTRALRDDARPLADAPALLCPSDGTISEFGPISQGRLLQAKGVHYPVAELLADPGLAGRYEGGQFMTIYLAPSDYHRVHMPRAGTLQHMGYVPGGLFSVNPATVAARKRLFSRNERVVCEFACDDSHFSMVLVGAMIVGGIRTPWAGRITPRTREAWQLPLTPQPLARGAEMGTFELGSTVILLFPPDQVTFEPTLEPGHKVRMGQSLGQLQQPLTPAEH